MNTQNQTNLNVPNSLQSKSKKIKPITITLIVCAALIFCIGVSVFSTTQFNNDMTQALEYISSHQFDKAKEILDQQLNTNSFRDIVYIIYSDYYLERSEFLEAIDILEKGIKHCSSDDNLQKKINQIKKDHAVELQKLRAELAAQQAEIEAQQAALEAQKKEEELAKIQKKKEEYISSCQQIPYTDLARNPDKYKGQAFVFTGEIIQVVEPIFGNTVTLRINVTKSEYGYYTDTIYATIELPKDSDRLLEKDIITIYGNCEGLCTYTSILGAAISIPEISIQYFELNT